MKKQCHAQGSTKSLQRSYSIKSMESDTKHVVASLNLKEIITTILENICLQTVKLILLFLNVNLLHIVLIYLNVYKQMTC